MDSGDCAAVPARLVAETVYSYQELSLVTVNDVLVVLPFTVLVLRPGSHGPPLDADWYSLTV